MTAADRLLNRELSWLEFDRRVLSLAEEEDRPLLERVKFLAISSRNLDEFFQVRVSGLQDAAAASDAPVSPDGRSAAEQLALLRPRVEVLCAHAQEVWSAQLRPALRDAGIEIASFASLSEDEREELARRFRERIQPVLVPLSVDPSHPFPYISNLSLSVGALVRPRGAALGERFARVKVPPLLGRWWSTGSGRYLAVEELVEAHLETLFPDDDVLQRGHFRVTRDADLELAKRERSDLVADIEAGLRRRRRGSDAVRLEADAELGPRIRRLLVRELSLEEDEVYDVTGLLDLGGLWELYRLDRPDLKETPWTPRPVPGLGDGKTSPERFFAAIRERPRLVHHPYESFEAVEGLLRAAAADPQVHVIMATLYRTGGPESGIVRALELAASQGKQVAVLVELQARFDEASNLERARALEHAGAHIVYGVQGLKTHAKLVMVVREERGEFRRYCHVGTGNYNPDTARLYEDVGLFSCEEDLTRDVAELLHRTISSSASRRYRRLLVAPESLRSELVARIEREAEAPDGRIVLKLNNLSDTAVIDALYAASDAGTEIDLLVRGICCLRPGREGLSERIRVRSVLGRFLEHSRIFRFGSPARGIEYWIGSADLMPRNLDLRVEALAPVDDPRLQQRLEEVLASYLRPDVRAWELAPDGSWKRSGGTVDVQEELMRRAAQGSLGASSARAAAPTG